MIFRKTYAFFDKLEDRVRGALSHYPILYSLVGAIGIVLVWKGVWETAELFPILYGPVSILMGTAILLVTGLLVSFFIGDTIIISGLKREKKVVEKSERDLVAQKSAAEVINAKLDLMQKELAELEERDKGRAA